MPNSAISGVGNKPHRHCFSVIPAKEEAAISFGLQSKNTETDKIQYAKIDQLSPDILQVGILFSSLNSLLLLVSDRGAPN